jgi:DNA-directed RNA polymerase
LEDAYLHEIKRSQPDRWRSCGYLAEKLSEHIDFRIDAGKARSNWLRGIASKLADRGHPVRWTAPSGFPVLQESWGLHKKPISAGKIEVVTYIHSDRRDVGAQMRKIVANFVHSLDAAHMTLTICRLHSGRERLEHFGVIHDCFAVHACDVDRLSTALREEFVSMHRVSKEGGYLLESFRFAQQQVVEEKLPDAPLLGDFDIEEVLKSQYFFS